MSNLPEKKLDPPEMPEAFRFMWCVGCALEVYKAPIAAETDDNGKLVPAFDVWLELKGARIEGRHFMPFPKGWDARDFFRWHRCEDYK